MRRCGLPARRTGKLPLLLVCASALLYSSFAGAQTSNPDLANLGAPKRHQPAPIQLDAAPKPPTDQILVYFRPETDPFAAAMRYHMRVLYRLKSDPDAYVYRVNNAATLNMTVAALRANGYVRKAFVNPNTQARPFSFLPNDPYFAFNNPVGWPGQWYLANRNIPGRDIAVLTPWGRNVTGSGVTIGIVDEGVQIDHPDLRDNYDAADSYDFAGNTSDPSPKRPDENHGTAVAGLAAARGGNGLGITGVAPFAKFAALRVDFSQQTAAMFVDATTYHSNTVGAPIAVKNHSYGQTDTYIAVPAEDDALATSASFGTIHVFAAGNSRGYAAQDADKLDPQNSPNVITVAAMGSNGVFTDYGSFGANVFCCAPSDSHLPYTFGILTTDRTGTDGYNSGVYDPLNGLTDLFPDMDYASTFGGSSSAAPIVAGVMALGKQVQPKLDVRFAKHLLALTSVPIHLNDATQESDGGWKTNAAGFKFDPNYGFGLINANTFTALATFFTGVTPLQTETTALTTVKAAIPDYSTTGLTQTFTVNSTTPLESVQVFLDITHPVRGDLQAYLTSPSGTKSRLFIASGSDYDSMIPWTFLTNAFWGENPHGIWTLNVQDVAPGDTGVWNTYQVQMNMGRLIAVPTLSSLSTTNVPIGSGDLTLTATGTRFTPATYLAYNSTPLKTQFVSYGQLKAVLPASLFSAANILNVTAVTPAPGGTSNSIPIYVGPQLVVTNQSPLTRTGSTLSMTVKIANVGLNPAANVQMKVAFLQRASPALLVYASNQPLNLGTLAVGDSVTCVLNFDGSAISPGDSLIARSGILYTGGAAQGYLSTTAP